MNSHKKIYSITPQKQNRTKESPGCGSAVLQMKSGEPMAVHNECGKSQSGRIESICNEKEGYNSKFLLFLPF